MGCCTKGTSQEPCRPIPFNNRSELLREGSGDNSVNPRTEPENMHQAHPCLPPSVHWSLAAMATLTCDLSCHAQIPRPKPFAGDQAPARVSVALPSEVSTSIKEGPNSIKTELVFRWRFCALTTALGVIFSHFAGIIKTTMVRSHA